MNQEIRSPLSNNFLGLHKYLIPPNLHIITIKKQIKWSLVSAKTPWTHHLLLKFFKKSNDQMFTIGLIGDAKHVLYYINVYLKWDMSGMVSMAHIKNQNFPSFLHHAK